MFWRKRTKSQKKGVNYICPDCGAEEIIPYEVLEDFDMMYPEELLSALAHKFGDVFLLLFMQEVQMSDNFV